MVQMATCKYDWDIEWMTHQYLVLKKSICDIGVLLGVDQRLVHYHLKRNGVTFRNSNISKMENNACGFDEIKEQIQVERLAGAKVKDLQEKYAGIGYGRVAKLCAALPARKPIFKERVKSLEERTKLSVASKAQWAAMSDDQKRVLLASSKAAKMGEKNINFGKVWGGKGRGTRVNGVDSHGTAVVFRSTWESKFAEFLTKAGFTWTYEPKTFRCGLLGTYTPDFYVASWGCYVEVKGWLTEKAKAKIEWFRQTQECQIILATRDVLRNQYGLEIR
jgi:hypothetical protein